jgi:Cys-rich repeat protein
MAGAGGAGGVGGKGGAGGATVTPGTCNVETDCKLGLHCDTAAKKCVECLSTAQCTLRAGLGLTKCDTSSSSMTFQRCVTCVADADCGAGKVCTLLHFCVFSPCSNSGGTSTCPAAAPKCEDSGIAGVTVPICVPCEGTELVCPATTPLCQPAAGACVKCLADGDCANTNNTPPTLRCDPTTFSCVGCRNNADCGVGAPFCDPRTLLCSQ